MKKSLVAAACVLALSTVVASAQSSQGNVGPGAETNRPNSGMANNPGGMSGPGTVGGGSGGTAPRSNIGSGDPNGTAGGPTSLSGTGSSQFGGNAPGATR